MIHYVYMTTNLINGKRYIGSRTNENPEKDSYLGSGVALGLAIEKYGRQNFEKKILGYFPTRQVAFDNEEPNIILFDTLSPNGYNISPTGGLHCSGRHAEYSKDKISKSLTGRKVPAESRLKMSESGKKKVFSLEHRLNIAKAGIGRKIPMTEEHRRRLSESHIGKSSLIGKKYDIIECPHCGKTGGVPAMKQWHFDNCKFRKYAIQVDKNA